jgi:hypothetical protein
LLTINNLDRIARKEKQYDALVMDHLVAMSAVLATAGQYLFFPKARKKTDYDWVYIAGGALLGGFTATVWYPIGPHVAGLYILPLRSVPGGQRDSDDAGCPDSTVDDALGSFRRGEVQAPAR